MFPRSSGRCQVHHVPLDAINLRQCWIRIEVIPEKGLSAGLKWLQSEKKDLIKGDLVVFDSLAFYGNLGIAVYDGIQLLNLIPNISYRSLPPSILVEDAPYDYWHWKTEEKFPETTVEYYGASYLYHYVDMVGLDGIPSLWISADQILKERFELHRTARGTMTVFTSPHGEQYLFSDLTMQQMVARLSAKEPLLVESYREGGHLSLVK